MKLALSFLLLLSAFSVQAEIKCSASKDFQNISSQIQDITPEPGTPEYDDYDVEEEPQTLSLKTDGVDFEVVYLPYQDYFWISATELSSGVTVSSYSDLTVESKKGRYSMNCRILEE